MATEYTQASGMNSATATDNVTESAPVAGVAYTQTAGMDGDTTTDNVTELAQQAVASAASTAADLILTDADTVATAADRVATGVDRSAVAADLVLTDADATATAADRVQTGLDTTATAADAVATAADRVITTQDALDTAADLLLTDADTIATAADRVQTGLDAASTAADLVQTNIDQLAVAADLVLTNADQIATAADRSAVAADLVQTNLDQIATAADRVVTTQDALDTAADVVLTNSDAAATAADLLLTAADTVATAADRTQTGLDRTATAADLVQTNIDQLAAAADAAQVVIDKAAVAADLVLTAADTVATAADRVVTTQDALDTAADVVLTNADVVTAEAAAVSAAASFDSFDDRYLGAKSSDPTLDNDGAALLTGALYFNDVSDDMKVYDGAEWLAAYASLSGALLATSNLSDLASAPTARTNLGVAIGSDVQAYALALANTTASYTTAEETKLAGVETDADVTDTGNVVASLTAGANVTISAGGTIAATDTNTTYSSNDFTHDALTGFVANEHIDWTVDQGTTNINAGNYTDTNTTYNVGDGGLTQINFTTVKDSKLTGIEAGADVTDTANVASAGALMDSEVDADIKTLVLPASTTISAFGASLIDDAAASNARTTLGLGSAATTASTDYATAAQGALADTSVQRTATTGQANLPSGTTAQRTATPATGAFRFNSTDTAFEGYDGTSWGAVGGGGSSVATLTPAATVDIDLTDNHFTLAMDQNTTITMSNVSAGVDTFSLKLTGHQITENYYDVPSASSTGKSFNVGGYMYNPTVITFSTDGTAAFVLDGTLDTVFQWSLPIAWDVTTAVYAGQFSVWSNESKPTGCQFKTDGAKMYIIGSTGDDINEYALSTAWDVTTATFTASKSVSAQSSNPIGLFFKADGTEVYFISLLTPNTVFQYTLSTAWDISTASYSGNSVDITAQGTISYTEIRLTPDGLEMYVLWAGNTQKYNLSTAWDVSTATYASETTPLSGLMGAPSKGFAFKDDGKSLFLCGRDPDLMVEVSIDGSTYATVTYPAAFNFPGGVAPDVPKLSEINILDFVTTDGGTSWYGTQIGEDYK